MAAISNPLEQAFRKATTRGGDLNPIEKVFDAVGLGSGPYAPFGRMVVGAGVGYAAMELIKPDFAYTPDGAARPWSFTQEGADNAGTATAVPWWVGPAAGAAVCGMFI